VGSLREDHLDVFLKSAPPELTQKGAVIVLNRHAPAFVQKGCYDEFLAGHILGFILWIVFMVSSPRRSP
jgi:hypothetical protein